MRTTGWTPPSFDEARGRVFPTTALAAILMLAAIVAIGCSPAARATIPPDATASMLPVATGTPALSTSPSPAATFPLTLTDDEGTSVTIPARPSKIVSLTPATTEILFALGAGDRIIAKVEDTALYPPEAGRIPNVAKFGSVDVEKIVGLGADLVIAGGNTFTPPEAIAQLRSLHVPTVVVYAPTVAKVFEDVALTGQAVGRGDAGRDLAASMRAQFDQIGAATSSVSKPRTWYEIDATGAFYGPADDSFLAEMIRLAGGDPITTGSPNKFDIPAERLIAADPQVILLGDAAYGVTAAQVASRPGWQTMTAVATHAIKPVDDTVVTRPGPRIVDGLRALVAALHPELVLPSPVASVAP
jgi:iron complex transport system substrate-binding protein